MKKRPFLVLIISLITLSCSNKNVESENPDIFVDPQVKVWFDENKDNPDAVLPVLVSTRDQIDKKYNLRWVKENYYSGRISVAVLKELMMDKKVIRINSSQKIKH